MLLYQADYSFSNIPWSGTGFVTLSNACSTSGCSVSNPIYWDENSGPSAAYENTIGSIPSEAFTLTGTIGTSTGTDGSRAERLLSPAASCCSVLASSDSPAYCAAS